MARHYTCDRCGAGNAAQSAAYAGQKWDRCMRRYGEDSFDLCKDCWQGLRAFLRNR